MPAPAILYCHCQYAKVLPEEVKQRVLRRLCEAELPFEAVTDLCEMSARRDPCLQRLSAIGAVKIAACYPRAVKGLFAAANAPLCGDRTEVVNLRELSAEAACEALLASEVTPNLPKGRDETAQAPIPSTQT